MILDGLPGPRRFIKRIVNSLAAGGHALVKIPKFPHLDIAPALVGSRVREFSHEIETSHFDGFASPLDHLVRDFVGDCLPSERTIARVCRADSIAERLFVITVDDGPSANAWLRFVDDWARVVSVLPAYQQSLMCLIVRGGRPTLRSSAPHLVEEFAWWEGAVSETDILFHAKDLSDGRHLTAVHAETAAYVMAAVAGHDFEIVERLAQEHRDVLFDPAPLLAALAEERKWSQVDATRDGLSTGEVYQTGNRLRRNAASLVGSGDSGKVRGLVWRGQVAALFPMIEECRMAFLDYCGSEILTQHSGDVSISTVFDLELTHIVDGLRGAASRKKQDLFGAALRLRSIRNALAHHEIVDWPTIDDAPFTNVIGLTA